MVEYILNSQFLKTLYPDELPLDGCISDIHFTYDGPSILIHFHTKILPKTIPKKWSKNSNGILIIFEFIDFDISSFQKFNTENNVNMSIINNDDKLYASFKGENFNLEFNCKWIYCKKISAYVDSESTNQIS